MADRTYANAVRICPKALVLKKYTVTIDDVLPFLQWILLYFNTCTTYFHNPILDKHYTLENTCVKGGALNSEDWKKRLQLAKENNVILAETMTLYHMPVYKQLRKAAENLGEACMIQNELW